MGLRHFLVGLAILIAIGVGGSTRAGAQAPSPEALAAAKELTATVNASLMAEMIKNLNTQVWPDLEKAIRSQYPKIDPATIGELRKEFERLQNLAVQEVLQDAASIYARYLTADEMRAMTGFYRTPAGAKSLSVMPKVTNDVIAAMSPRVQALQARLTLAFLDVMQRRGEMAK